MLLEGNRIGAGNTDQLKKQAHQVEVILWFPLGALEDLSDILERMLDGRQIVADDKGTKGRAPDHDHLERKGL